MTTFFEKKVDFVKMQGCGNDFVAIDNRKYKIAVDKMPEWAVALCKRAFGIYADGIFFIEESEKPEETYRWHFYNADGSRAEMCGNASRCVGLLTYKMGIAGREHFFGTDAGSIQATVFPEDNLVKVRLTQPSAPVLNTKLTAMGQDLDVHFTNTGVPHAVVVVEDVDKVDVQAMGRALRMHEHFQPAGTNVNFIQVLGQNKMLLRTYERGVEDETYACGTGAAASLVISQALGLTGDWADITTTGGETLTLSLENGGLYLKGGAQFVFTGQVNYQALGLSL